MSNISNYQRVSVSDLPFVDVRLEDKQSESAKPQKSEGVIGRLTAYFSFSSKTASQQQSTEKSSWKDSIKNFFGGLSAKLSNLSDKKNFLKDITISFGSKKPSAPMDSSSPKKDISKSESSSPQSASTMNDTFVDEEGHSYSQGSFV